MVKEGSRRDKSTVEAMRASDLLYVTNSLLRAMISCDSLVFICKAATKSRDHSRDLRLVSKRLLVMDSGIAGSPAQKVAVPPELIDEVAATVDCKITAPQGFEWIWSVRFY